MNKKPIQRTEQPIALITGASKRLGLGIALALADLGFAICVHYNKSGEAAESTVELIKKKGVPAYCMQADLRSEDDILNLFSGIKALSFRFKVLVNSASVFEQGNLAEMSLSEWDQTMNLNLRAPWLCAREATKCFYDGKGVIINISDSGAGKVWTKYPAYVVSKSALETLTRLMARSFAPKIRVNAVAPGLIEKSEMQPETDWQQLVNRLPLKRSGFAEEIAHAVCFLVKNEYITGEILTVDGGYHLV